MSDTNDKITAFYCRYSVKNDEAIEKQKELLLDYAKENGIENYEFYIDNGYKGTSLDRPSFQQLLDDSVNKNKIAAICVKNKGILTRDGEHYKTLKKVFAAHGVAVIELQKSYLDSYAEQVKLEYIRSRN
jgi:DNA invertase Pin-like site-specific DNA recombinase